MAKPEGQIIRIVPLQDTGEIWIPLKHASAVEVVNFLSELYLAQEGAKPEEAALKASVIKAHPQLPKILVRGPKEVLAEITKLVNEELDLPAEAETPETPIRREYFSLDYMSAVEFKLLVEDDEEIAKKFTSLLAPNNTLIVASRSAAVFAKVAELKTTFDVDRMEIRYQPLSNAQADSVAKLLKEIYPTEAPVMPVELQRVRREMSGQLGIGEQSALADVLAQAGISGPSAQELMSRAISVVAVGELTIIPDIERNGLLIRTFSRNFTKVLELIDVLDKPRRQVLIEVFITQVQLDNEMELGVDFSFSDNIEYRNREYTLAQTLGAALQGTGLNYQLISNNLSIFLHALQSTGKVDVISWPLIQTKNNAEAVISMGRQVPMVTTTKVSTEGAVSSEVKYEDVTTTLTVTPQIHPDDFVSLLINQTIDDVGTERFQISEDFNPQVLIRRKAKTQLRVKDGQTVCLGGFRGYSITETEERVPLLADIPLLGELFKYSTHERVKTELVIFLTPHILATPEEMLRMTNEQRRRALMDRSDGRGDGVLEEEDSLRYPRYRDALPVGPNVPAELSD